MKYPRNLIQYWIRLSAVVIILLATGCDGGKIMEPSYPNQDQVAEAVEELLQSTPEKDLPIGIGPAIEKILTNEKQPRLSDDYLVSNEPGMLEFKCGSRSCACVEGDNIPEDKKNEWLCEGMGAVCANKGFISKFPCSITSAGTTICVCIHPDGLFK